MDESQTQHFVSKFMLPYEKPIRAHQVRTIASQLRQIADDLDKHASVNQFISVANYPQVMPKHIEGKEVKEVNLHSFMEYLPYGKYYLEIRLDLAIEFK